MLNITDKLNVCLEIAREPSRYNGKHAEYSTNSSLQLQYFFLKNSTKIYSFRELYKKSCFSPQLVDCRFQKFSAVMYQALDFPGG